MILLPDIPFTFNHRWLRPFYSTAFPHRRITHRIEMYLQPLFQRRLHLSPLRLREAGEEVHSPWRWMLFTPVHLHTELCHHPSQGTGCQLPGSPCWKGSDVPSRSVLLALALKWVCICLPQSTLVEGTASPGRWEGKKQGQLGLGAAFISVLGAPKIMASGPITSWEIDGEIVETVSRLYFSGLQNPYRWWLQPWN